MFDFHHERYYTLEHPDPWKGESDVFMETDVDVERFHWKLLRYRPKLGTAPEVLSEMLLALDAFLGHYYYDFIKNT